MLDWILVRASRLLDWALVIAAVFALVFICQSMAQFFSSTDEHDSNE